MHNKKLYGTATVGTKGQVVIPASAREELNINPGDRLYVVGSCGDGYLGMIKEDMIESLIKKMSLHLENIRSLKNEPEDK